MKPILMRHHKGGQGLKMGIMITSVVTGLIMLKACRMVTGRRRVPVRYPG